MNQCELAIAQLRSLPLAVQDQAVQYIQQLHVATRVERLEALRKTSGCLSPDEAEAFEKAIAALAREHQLPLAARDSHFERVEGITLIKW